MTRLAFDARDAGGGRGRERETLLGNNIHDRESWAGTVFSQLLGSGPS